MEESKKRNILIIMFGVIILLLLFIIYLLIKNNRSSVEDNYGRLKIVDISKENENEEETTNDILDNSSEKENISTNNLSYSEGDVISYFDSNEKDIKSNSFKEKFKDYFIEIVDFIFYGTEIKGHTFNELTNTGKLKIISVALKIDSLIEDKVPGYKDGIKSTGSKVYINAKEKLTELFFNIATNVCNDRESDCDKAKELFGDIKNTCKIGWSFIKGLLKNGGEKLRDWYEIYSGK